MKTVSTNAHSKATYEFSETYDYSLMRRAIVLLSPI